MANPTGQPLTSDNQPYVPTITIGSTTYTLTTDNYVSLAKQQYNYLIANGHTLGPDELGAITNNFRTRAGQAPQKIDYSISTLGNAINVVKALPAATADTANQIIDTTVRAGKATVLGIIDAGDALNKGADKTLNTIQIVALVVGLYFLTTLKK